MNTDTPAESKRFRDAGLFMLAWIFWLLLIIAFEYVLKDFKPSLAAGYLISGALELMLLLPAAAYVQMKRIVLQDLFGRARAAQVAAGAFAGALLVPATMPLTLFWSLFIRLTGGNLDVSPVITAPQTALQFIAAFAAMSLAAPIVEEPVMRGLALNGAGGTLGRAKAVLLVSAMFALMHGRFMGLPAIFAAGLLLAALAWRSGSLWPSVAAHASYNTLSLIVSALAGYFARKGAAVPAESLPIPQFLIASFVYLAIALPFAAAIVAIFGRSGSIRRRPCARLRRGGASRWATAGRGSYPLCCFSPTSGSTFSGFTV